MEIASDECYWKEIRVFLCGDIMVNKNIKIMAKAKYLYVFFSLVIR